MSIVSAFISACGVSPMLLGLWSGLVLSLLPLDIDKSARDTIAALAECRTIECNGLLSFLLGVDATVDGVAVPASDGSSDIVDSCMAIT